jgi:hypothetical protein
MRRFESYEIKRKQIQSHVTSIARDHDFFSRRHPSPSTLRNVEGAGIAEDQNSPSSAM